MSRRALRPDVGPLPTAVLMLLGVAGTFSAAPRSSSPQPQRPDNPGVFLSPCDIPGVKEKARCGTFEVWEDRDRKAGRRIGLKVVLLPATGSPAAGDALTYLGGGPGEAATNAAPYFAQQVAAIHRQRDIILVDQRGTGGSHGLECDLYPGNDPQTALGAFFPAERVRQCRAALETTADLRLYTTAAAADDLDEVREALGYRSLDVFGASYGTRAALVYIRRHPTRVRTAVLFGITPPSDLMPLRFAQHAQHAIENVFADCRADAACHAAFPDPDGELRAIVARAAAKPVPVEILDPATGDPVQVRLSRNLLGEALRYLMYQSGSALYVPLLVHQAAAGDFAPLAEFALGSRRQLVNSLGQGLYLSVTCAEDLPFIDAAEAERLAENTFLGDYRYRDQRAACGAWARGSVPADAREPIRADTPALLFSGTWDPVTPASNATLVAATLPRSLSVVIPSGGHSYHGLVGAEACVGTIANRFVEHGGPSGIDTSCIGRIRRPPFPTRPLETKPVPLRAEESAAIVGRYVGEDAPPLEITLTKGKLTGRVEGDKESIVLVPVSPTRLRLLGPVGSYLDVEMRGGKGVRLTLRQAGVPVLAWTRSR